MKFKDLKDYHAYYVTAVLFLVTCFVMNDFVFFPFACCFVCLGAVKQLKAQGRLSNTRTDAAALGKSRPKPEEEAVEGEFTEIVPEESGEEISVEEITEESND